MRDERELRRFFSGRLRNIKILRNDEALSASIYKRNVIHADLERAETKLIQKAHAN
jgi:hypothetical protein